MWGYRVLFALVAVSFLSTVQADWFSSADSKDPEACPASCLQDLNTGYPFCRWGWNHPRYYYNKESQKCEFFQYSGCGGNSNNFKTKKYCMEKCNQCRNHNVNDLEASGSPRCDCIYETIGLKKPGCRITYPPPAGYKCQCTHNAWQYACKGQALPCNKPEECPANCESKKCCQKGMGRDGNCDGYPPWAEPVPGQQTADEKKFRDCMILQGVQGGQVIDKTTNETYYNLINFQWNKRLPQVFPIIYVLPKTDRDVSAAVRCGRLTKIRVIPNSGANSFEALSFGTGDSVIIDFRNMKNVFVDGGRGIVRLQPGALVGPTAAMLWKIGGLGVPLGNCLTDGVTGEILEGGIGYFSGLFGLASDNVVSMTVVDASGKILLVSEEQNPEMFWAMRGVGSGYFGIVTEFRLKTFNANRLKLTLIRVQFPVEAFAQVYYSFQGFSKWLDSHEPSVFAAMYATSDKRTLRMQFLNPGIELHVLHIQDPELQPHDSSQLVAELKNIFPSGKHIVEYPKYMDAILKTGYTPIMIPSKSSPNEMISVRSIADQSMFPRHKHGSNDAQETGNEFPDDLLKLKKDMAQPRYLKVKSLFVKKEFSLDQLNPLDEVMNTIPDNNIWIRITREHGAIAKPTPGSSAYVHRDSLFDFTIYHEGRNTPRDVADGKAFQKKLWQEIQFMDGGETYQGNVDLDDRKYLKRYYGSNLKRLSDAKLKYDTQDYFHNPRSIPISIGTNDN